MRHEAWGNGFFLSCLMPRAACLPVASRNRAVAEHDRLTRQPFVAGDARRLHPRRRAEVFGAVRHLDFTSAAYADSAAGVSERRSGPAGGVEQRFVRFHVGHETETNERYSHNRRNFSAFLTSIAAVDMLGGTMATGTNHELRVAEEIVSVLPGGSFMR